MNGSIANRLRRKIRNVDGENGTAGIDQHAHDYDEGLHDTG